MATKQANKLIPLRFITGNEALKERGKIYYITTGSKAFDEMMQGGIESGCITEIFGEFRTGKTQLCHTLCVTSQLPKSKGGGEGKVIFIDTEGTFRPEVVSKIAQRYDLDPTQVLENICVAKAHNTDQMMALLVQCAALMSEDKYALLIVDSATHNFRTEYFGRGELSVRQNVLAKFLKCLQRLTDDFGVVVLITNQVMAKVDGFSSFGGDNKTPIGGHILAHASNTRLYFKKSKESIRKVKIYDSPSLPELTTEFRISEQGVCDV